MKICLMIMRNKICLYLTNYIIGIHKEINHIYIEENKKDNISINNYNSLIKQFIDQLFSPLFLVTISIRKIKKKEEKLL
jgi:hypothetical protein